MLPIEEAILEKLRSGPCCLDDILTYLPNCSWGEIFVAVDRMSRDGRVLLRQLGYSTYEISLASRVASSSSTPTQTGQTTGNVMPMPQVAAS
jgi:hypothetical protein